MPTSERTLQEMTLWILTIVPSRRIAKPFWPNQTSRCARLTDRYKMPDSIRMRISNWSCLVRDPFSPFVDAFQILKINIARYKNVRVCFSCFGCQTHWCNMHLTLRWMPRMGLKQYLGPRSYSPLPIGKDQSWGCGYSRSGGTTARPYKRSPPRTWELGTTWPTFFDHRQPRLGTATRRNIYILFQGIRRVTALTSTVSASSATTSANVH